jgi:phosphoribosylcarboxyaminoimidazole (NCAIR) mutase
LFNGFSSTEIVNITINICEEGLSNASSLFISIMSTNNSDIAERIATARHEAETLKEKIKQKKDALADTTRK